MIELCGNEYRRDGNGKWGVVVSDDEGDDYECSSCLCEALDEIERLAAENADLLFTLRVQIGAVIAETDDERDAVSRGFEKARKP
jgi:hypothetical protein